MEFLELIHNSSEVNPAQAIPQERDLQVEEKGSELFSTSQLRLSSCDRFYSNVEPMSRRAGELSGLAKAAQSDVLLSPRGDL
jgi:hypothetical protein